MNYQRTNNKSIDEAFLEFHKANPDVYVLFISYTKNWLRAINKDNPEELQKLERCLDPTKKSKEIFNTKKRISSKHVIGRIRWFHEVEQQIGDYKINDAFTSRYSRKFINDYPGLKNVFEFRELRSG
ncbi:MAG: hypothetical protein WC358_08335, partial [Ignavibacteria bacterium]